MMADPVANSPAFCFNCGNPLRAGARFCSSCGAKIPVASSESAVYIPTNEPQPDPSVQENAFILPGFPMSTEPSPSGKEDSFGSAITLPEPQNELPSVHATPTAEPAQQIADSYVETAAQAGYSLTLDVVPAQARGRTILALRQALNLSPQDAATYVTAAPALLAVGLPVEMAEMLRVALTNAGAVVTLQAPLPREEPEPTEPAPEPRRRLDSQEKTMIVKRTQTRRGLYTVTGLDLGSTNAYLAYARADGSRLAAQPEMVSIDSQTAIPAMLVAAGGGKPSVAGLDAQKIWVRSPEVVQTGLIDLVGEDDTALPALRAFLESLAGRLHRVLMPGALSIAEGANTKLAVPADWDLGRSERLVEMATQAGFPVSRVVPAPVAVLAHHIQQGTLRVKPRQQKTMVIDWGGSSLAISFIEHGGEINRPSVFEHVEHPLGGDWFDQLIGQALEQQLSRELSDEDQRAFRLFTRRFKEQMSKAFSEGKNSYSQYCVIPASAQPVRVQVGKEQFEGLAAEALERFRVALLDSVDAIGLKPEHLDHVIIAGGGGRWYFAREIARSTLLHAPTIGACPEEACARGLAVFNLDSSAIS